METSTLQTDFCLRKASGSPDGFKFVLNCSASTKNIPQWQNLSKFFREGRQLKSIHWGVWNPLGLAGALMPLLRDLWLVAVSFRNSA